MRRQRVEGFSCSNICFRRQKCYLKTAPDLSGERLLEGLRFSIQNFEGRNVLGLRGDELMFLDLNDEKGQIHN